MPLALALLAPMLVQVGPLVTPGAAPPLPHQQQAEPLRPPRRVQPQAQAAPSPQRACLERAENAPAEAETLAEAWLAKAKGPEAGRKQLWPWILLAGVGVLMLEWFVYNKKVHV